EKLDRKPEGLLALGGVEYGPGKPFSALPGTNAEVDNCRDRFHAAFPKERIATLGGDKATVEALQQSCQQGYRSLHLAPQVLFDPPERLKQLAAVIRAANRDQLRLLHEQEGTLAGLPLLRCGLSLAGANKPRDPAKPDEPVGVLLGEQVGALDLRGCE